MNIKIRFEELLTQHGDKHWVFAAKKDSDFIISVGDATAHLPDNLSFSERVYCAVNDFDPRCPQGNRKKLISFPKGWSFCGPAGKCACAKAVISQKSHENVDHEARLAKTKATLLSRYGVSNPAELPQAQIAHASFYADSSKVAEVTARMRATVKKNDSYRHRREKSQEAILVKKRKRKEIFNTWSEAAIPSDMIACMICNRAFKIISEAHCRAHSTTLSEYISAYPLSPISCVSVTAAREKYARSDENKKRLQALSRAAHTDEARDLLFDDVKLREKLKRSSITAIAQEISVDPETVRRYALATGHTFEVSSYEREISAFLIDSAIPFIPRTRKIIKPKELDFYLPDHKLAIEFNGLYWHSDAVVDNSYHRDKWERCQAASVRLLMINEDEWTARPEVMKKKILNLCGKSEKGCGARKLLVHPITNKEGLDFVDQHHIQGRPATCSVAYGAFWNEELIAVITLSRQRGTGHLDLNRFCTDGRVFAGAFSKILSVIRREVSEPIVTFADLRYSDGGLYEKCGFVNEGMIPPDYRYIKRNQTFHKSLFTKARIAKKFDIDMSNLTEREAMLGLGYARIYDCGKIRYRLI